MGADPAGSVYSGDPPAAVPDGGDRRGLLAVDLRARGLRRRRPCRRPGLDAHRAHGNHQRGHPDGRVVRHCAVGRASAGSRRSTTRTRCSSSCCPTRGGTTSASCTPTPGCGSTGCSGRRSRSPTTTGAGRRRTPCSAAPRSLAPRREGSGRGSFLRLPARALPAIRLVAVDAAGVSTNAGALAIRLHPCLPDVDLVAAQRAGRRIVHAADDTPPAAGRSRAVTTGRPADASVGREYRCAPIRYRGAS